MTITMLGNSALVPRPGRAETAATLECAGHMILFDCGEGTQCAAAGAGAAVTGTDMIALTHYHGDHIFGLPGLMQTMTMMGRTAPLLLIGPEGLEQAMKPILELVGWTPYDVVLKELPAEGVQLCELAEGWPGKARLTPFRTQHRVTSQGYIVTLGRAGRFLPQRANELGVPQNLWGRLQKGETLEVNGRRVEPSMVMGEARRGLKFVFSGDTAACESLTTAAADADLLICEATYGENEQGESAMERGHMTFAQAGRTAAEAGARRLWLTHFSQMIEEPEDYLPNAQAFFPRAECGTDGKRIILKFEQ